MDHTWQNRLTITGDPADIARFLQRANGPEANFQPGKSDAFWRLCPPEVFRSMFPAEPKVGVFSFHALVPVPAAVLATGYLDGGQAWQAEHWGCCRNAERAAVQFDGGDRAVCTFEATWAPVLLLDAVVAEFPGLGFRLQFVEPDDEVFGNAEWQEGRRTSLKLLDFDREAILASGFFL